MKGLDLGCGRNKHPDCIGLDMNGSLEGVDVVHEICREKKLPFEDNITDRVYAHDIVEHVDDVAWLLSEIHRVSIPDAKIEIQYPHYSGRNAYNDVTHRRLIGLQAFNHFIPNTKEGKKYPYYTFFERYFPFALESSELKFKIGGISPVIYRLFGADFYESYASQLFPISTVRLNLRVLKAKHTT